MTSTEAETIRSLAIDGTTVEYAEHDGDGPPIPLVHAGVFGAWFAPLATEPALRGRRLIRMIRAGYTGGPAPATHLSIVDHARHCAPGPCRGAPRSTRS